MQNYVQCPKCHITMENGGFCPYCGFDFAEGIVEEKADNNNLPEQQEEHQEQPQEITVYYDPYGPESIIKKICDFIYGFLMAEIFAIGIFNLILDVKPKIIIENPIILGFVSNPSADNYIHAYIAVNLLLLSFAILAPMYYAHKRR